MTTTVDAAVRRVCARAAAWWDIPLHQQWSAGSTVDLPFTLHGRPSKLRMDLLGSRVISRLSGDGPGVLKIYPQGMGASIAKLFGAQDFEVGDDRFDALYVVKARPAGLAGEIFRPGRKTEAIAAVRRIGKFVSPPGRPLPRPALGERGRVAARGVPPETGVDRLGPPGKHPGPVPAGRNPVGGRRAGVDRAVPGLRL